MRATLLTVLMLTAGPDGSKTRPPSRRAPTVLLVVAMVSSLGLAGCIGDGDGDTGLQPTATPTDRVQEDPVVHFRDGQRVDVTPDDAPDPRARTVLTGLSGAEPSIGILPSGSIFVQAFEQTLASTDAGETWETVYDFESATGGGTSDPMLWVDRDTERVYWNHMAPPLVCSAIGWSEDEGQTWDRNDAACGLPGIDFQKLGGGPPGPGPNPLAGDQHPSVLYLCYNKPLVAVCAPSYDGGETWPIEVPITCDADASGPTLRCPLVRAPPAVGPEGTAYVPVGAFSSTDCPRSLLAVSTDSGLTWTSQPGPAGASCMSIDALDVAPDGTLYVAGEASEEPVTYLARSTDHGQTWQGPWPVSPPDVGMVAFEAVTAGADGRVGVALVATNETGGSPGAASEEARWDLHMVITEDADSDQPTFTSVQATDDPVQVGPICLGGVSCPDARNLLDFIDADTHPDGRFYVAYTDGCTGQCAEAADPAPEDSRDNANAVAWLEGFSLTERSP